MRKAKGEDKFFFVFAFCPVPCALSRSLETNKIHIVTAALFVITIVHLYD
jgi:hypothetical protein